MEGRIYVIDAIKLLKYKKRCSFNRWARLNSVSIYSDIGTNRHYVLESEFHEALSRNPIRLRQNMCSIKENPEAFNSYMRVTGEYRSSIDQKSNINQQNGNAYIPTGVHENSILVKWTKELSEL